MTDDPKPWTGEEFSRFAMRLVGTTHGWQSAVARMLNVNSRTVRRWVAKGLPNLDVQADLLRLAGLAFPRDEWIVGDGPETGSNRRRKYVVHTRPPRFIARVVELDELTGEPQPDEDPVDRRGMVYQSVGVILCEFRWDGRPPSGPELARLMEEAADLLEEE